MKLDYRLTFLVGLGFLTISVFWQVYEFVIPLIMLKVFAISDTVAGFVMSFDNVLALFMIPVFGMLSDKTTSPIGRRMPYIIVGTGVSVIFMLLIPFSVNHHNLALFIVSLAFVLLAMSSYRSPAVALMPDVTPKPLRSKGNAVINLMGALGGIIALSLITLLAPEQGSANYWPVFLVVALIMVGGVVLLKLMVNEPQAVASMEAQSLVIEVEDDFREVEDAKKLPKEYKLSLIFILLSVSLWYMGYNAVTSAFSKYALVALHIGESRSALILVVASLAAVISFLPVAMISTKVGRKKTILVGVAVLALVFASMFFYREFSPLMFVSFSLAGISWAAINVNSLPMVLEMAKGSNVGRYTGYYYTFSMAAQVITPIFSGFLLQNVGYFVLLPYAATFVSLSFLTMLLVKHGDSKPLPIKGKLEVFEEMDG
ncbi:MFS transporter [Eubacteriaceae bacterium ES3]|nr:MFS transporter [Eubacteriaceae bacterium ES3]